MALTAWGYEPCPGCGTPVGSDCGATLCQRCEDTLPRCQGCGEPMLPHDRDGDCHLTGDCRRRHRERLAAQAWGERRRSRAARLR